LIHKCKVGYAGGKVNSDLWSTDQGDEEIKGFVIVIQKPHKYASPPII
jgi:hypothetical protein